jgi:hypothetical protein
MELLKLVALDAEDLTILSAHLQDAVLKVGDLRYDRKARRFLLPLYRYVWEGRSRTPERRNTVLDFGRVAAVRSQGMPQDRPQEVLSLLTVRFEAAEPPSGTIELVFSAGAMIRVEAECIEARLSDLGGAWEASSRPRHDS